VVFKASKMGTTAPPCAAAQSARKYNFVQKIKIEIATKQQRTFTEPKNYLESELNFISNAYSPVFCYLFTISTDVRRNKAKQATL
jgi:hypothetical protein